MRIGSAQIYPMTKLRVMMMKNEQAAGCTGAAAALQRAKDVPPVCVSDVKFAVSQTAAARPAQTSQRMLRLNPAFQLMIFYTNLLHLFLISLIIEI